MSSEAVAPTSLEYALLVLKAVPGTSGVAAYPKGRTAARPTDNKVQCVYTPPDGGEVQLIKVCGSGAAPDKLTAALEVRRQLAEKVGPDAIAAAEATVRRNLGLDAPQQQSFFEASQMRQRLLAQQSQLKEQLKPATKRLKDAAAAVQAAEELYEAAEREVELSKHGLAEVQEQLATVTMKP